MIHVRSFVPNPETGMGQTACGLTKITQEEIKQLLTGDKDISNVELMNTVDCPVCFEMYASFVERLRRSDPERLNRLQRKTP